MGGEFLLSQEELRKKAAAKWRGVKLVLMTSTVIIFSIPVALLPSAIRRVRPTVEFAFLVVAPGLWNSVSTWITAPCLYVLLNIVLVTLGVISRATPNSNDDQVHNSGTVNRSISPEIESIETKLPDADYNNFSVESKLSDPVQNDLSPAASPADQVQKPAAVIPIVESRSRSLKDLKAATMTPGAGPGLYAKKSRLRRSTVKLSNLSRESRKIKKMISTESACSPAAPKTSPPRLVVFEISTESVGDYYMQNEEVTMVEAGYGESNLKADELYMKAESFIGDFYRQLKMQREDSWNRLCGIYRRSC